MAASLWFEHPANDDNIVEIMDRIKLFKDLKADTPVRILDLQAHNKSKTKEPATTGLLTMCNLAEMLVEIYRNHCCQTPFCDSIYALTDQLIALQLVLARMNKEENGMFEADSNEVISLHQNLIKVKLGLPTTVPASDKILKEYNKFLKHCNALDYADLVAKVSACFLASDGIKAKYQEVYQYAVIGSPSTDVETEMLKLLVGKRNILKYSPTNTENKWTDVTLDHLLSNVCQSIQLASGSQSNIKEAVQPLPGTPMSTPCRRRHSRSTPSPIEFCSPTSSQELRCTTPYSSPLSQGFETKEQFTSSLVLSYLQLLVNTRDELALARVINIPDRELGPYQFTVIRKEADEKRMTMFQTATSFILKIRLGGKGYAPPEDSPLHLMTKGLGEFVSFFQKLQNVLEDIEDPKAAVARILAILQSNLIKARDAMLQAEDVRKVITKLKQQLDQLSKAPVCPQPQGTHPCHMIGVASYKLIQGLLDMNMLGDYSQSAVINRELRTPRSVRGSAQSLLTKFRTPEAPSPEDEKPSRLRDGVVDDIEPVKQKDKSKGSLYGDMLWAKPAIPTLKDGKNTNTEVYIDTPGKPCGIFRMNTPTSSSRKRPREVQCAPENGSAKSPLRKRPCESANDQENVVASHELSKGTKKRACEFENDQENIVPSQELNKGSKRPSTKRGLISSKESSHVKSKKVPKGTGPKPKKNKSTKQIPGQKQMTHFFR